MFNIATGMPQNLHSCKIHFFDDGAIQRKQKLGLK